MVQCLVLLVTATSQEELASVKDWLCEWNSCSIFLPL